MNSDEECETGETMLAGFLVEEFKAREAKAKQQYKDDVLLKYKNKGNSPFKHLFRSKGFVWISNDPNAYFVWSQAAIQL